MYATHPGTRALAGGHAPDPAVAPVWPCPVVQVCSPSPPGAGLRQREPSRQWQEQLYRGKLRPFHQMNKEDASRAGVTSLARRGRGLLSDQWDMASKHPCPMLVFSPCSIPSGPDHWVKTSKPIPASWGKKKSGTKRGGNCLLRNLVGSGPRGSHHRRLKTRLTVRMMPRRRTKGSQVFTKAPTLTYFPYSRQKKQSVTMFQLVLLL